MVVKKIIGINENDVHNVYYNDDNVYFVREQTVASTREAFS